MLTQEPRGKSAEDLDVIERKAEVGLDVVGGLSPIIEDQLEGATKHSWLLDLECVVEGFSAAPLPPADADPQRGSMVA